MLSRRLIAAVAVLCLAFGAVVSALAQSKTKAVIQQEINQDFPDQNTGQITPAIVRGFLVDVMNSYFQWPAVNSQATGPYTLLNTDMGALVNVSSQATFTLILPQAVSPFYNGWSTFIKNIGPVTATLSPMNSTIGGSSTVSLATQAGIYVVSDGANWQTWGGVGVGTVTSVGLSLPSIFNVNGSPVTISGTLTGNLATQNANIVFAGPSSGAAASPTFRSLISTDVSGAITGSFTVPSFLNVTGSPCTATCNYVLGLALQSPNAAFVGPTSGASASPTFRALVSTDVSGAVAGSLAVPSFLNVTGSPCTATCNYVVGLATENANTHFAGPTSGAAASPTFRALVSNDMPTPNTTALGGVYSSTAVTHQFLTAINNSGTPQQAQPACGDLSNAAASCATDATNASNITTGALSLTRLAQVSPDNVVGNFTGSNAAPSQGALTSCSTASSALTYNTTTHVFGCNIVAGSGTVTSVAVAFPSIFSVNGSPITTSGTITANLATENANTVFAGPLSGAAASPTFRALASNDMPTPNTTSLGAIFSLVPATHNFITGINNSGTPQAAVPGISDLATVTPHSYVGNPTASQATPSSGTLGRTADWNQNTQNDVAMVVDQVRLAASPQFVNAASGTITLNFNNGMNFNTSIGVACSPCTIVTPQNLSQTWAGSLIITNASQNASVTFSKPIWKFASGTAPVASVTLNDVDVLNFVCVTPNAACYAFYGGNYQ